MSDAGTNTIFDRAEMIARYAKERHEGNLNAALVELTGSVDVADIYVMEWGTESLALYRRAFEIAEKESRQP